MKKIKLYILVFAIAIIGTSCEKVVDVGLPDGEALTYLDGWITDKPGVQQIKLLKAVNYLSQQQPEPVTGAAILVTDVTDDKTYTFNYDNGAYTYNAGAESIGVAGHTYQLDITYNGEHFRARDVLHRSTPVDSINYEFREEESEDEKEGYYAEFFARDAVGATDYYWIRTYRNGVLNPYTGEMVSIDGSFYENASDGFVFIEPFREGITSGEKPYIKGDNVKVVIRSLSKDAHNFMDMLLDQLYSEGLFSKILANVPSNITNLDVGSKSKIYGWFGTVAESELSVTIE